MKNSPWTKPVVEELKRLCAESRRHASNPMTTATIADALYVKFRHPFSKNAVISQMRKLGITNGFQRNGWIGNRERASKPVARPDQPRWIRPPWSSVGTKKAPAKLAKASAAVLDPATHVGLLDHRDDQCRWPVDEVSRAAPFLTYCGGAVVAEGCPYCAAHWRMSVRKHQPAEAA
jgi:hypothetical protein